MAGVRRRRARHSHQALQARQVKRICASLNFSKPQTKEPLFAHSPRLFRHQTNLSSLLYRATSINSCLRISILIFCTLLSLTQFLKLGTELRAPSLRLMVHHCTRFPQQSAPNTTTPYHHISLQSPNPRVFLEQAPTPQILPQTSGYRQRSEEHF